MPRPEHWQAVLDEYQADRRLPTLSAGVLRDGALVWEGYAGAPVAAGARFRIGSITKMMTAVLVLQCRDEGLLSLDDEVGRFVPETGYAPASLRALLSHTSGMQSEPVGPWWERNRGSTFDVLMSANDGSGRVFGPGEHYHYSNLGYALLGEVVAQLRGVPWREVVANRIWAPLGMNRTSYDAVDAVPGYSVDHLRGTLFEEPAPDTGAMAPAGQAWSTVGDLARFLGVFASGHPKVLAPETAQEMARPQPPAQTYGLGVFAVPGSTAVGHLGSMPGFQAAAFIDPGTGDGAVALTNATTGFAGIELIGRLLGSRTPSALPPWVPTNEVPDWAAELVGWWFWGNSAFEVRFENGFVEFRDVARGGVLAERFTLEEDRVLGVFGYHHGEDLERVRAADGALRHLECATFVYTRAPYDLGPFRAPGRPSSC